MSITFWSILIALSLFGGMLLAIEAGRAIRKARAKAGNGDPASGTGTVDGAIFALVGLLIAFTFTTAAGRFDARRALIIKEANAVGTAWLRMDLLDSDDTLDLRRDFSAYVEARINIFKNLEDPSGALAIHAEALRLRAEIWRGALASARAQPQPYVASLVLPALNDAFDISDERVAALFTHVPNPIIALLVSLSLLTALLAGHTMGSRGRRNWFHSLVFASAMSMAVYIILDLEFPRVGIIRLDQADRPLIELSASIRSEIERAGGG